MRSKLLCGLVKVAIVTGTLPLVAGTPALMRGLAPRAGELASLLIVVTAEGILLFSVAIAWHIADGLEKERLRFRFFPYRRVAENTYQPPRNLELLLHLILTQSDCEVLVGDLEERYRKLVKRLGKGRADIWYTKQVLTSIWPLLRAGMRRMGSSAVVGVVAFVLRLFGAGLVADELKRAMLKK